MPWEFASDQASEFVAWENFHGADLMIKADADERNATFSDDEWMEWCQASKTVEK